jgi:hypothetical protein
MSFFFKWLRPERPPGVALHPSRTVEVDMPFEVAFDRCIEGIEGSLGGVVRDRDPQRGTIEATFGLVNSERLNVTLERMQDGRTRVIIDSRRGLSMEPARSSQYVDALAQFLQPARPAGE